MSCAVHLKFSTEESADTFEQIQGKSVISIKVFVCKDCVTFYRIYSLDS